LASLHFLTLRNKYRLPLALVASLLLHILPWLLNQIPPPKPPPPPKPSLTATLAPQALPTPVAPPPELILPEPPKPEAPPPPKPEKQKPREKQPNSAKTWNQAIAQQLKSLNDRHQYYPQEAISQGLQGEVLVLVIIDENGNITAARIEESSGHRLLDDAALRNVRTIRSLPADAPREALLPLRFKLY
jgi:protein TonB